VRQAILISIIFLAGCGSNDQLSTVAAKCPATLVQQRAVDAQSSDIVVVGKWQSLETDLVPETGVVIGNIAVSQTLRGALEPDAMVGIVTGDISDPQGNMVQCGLKAPVADQEHIFYISRGANSLQIIDYRPNSES
jgi:hypothetical protein